MYLPVPALLPVPAPPKCMYLACTYLAHIPVPALQWMHRWHERAMHIYHTNNSTTLGRIALVNFTHTREQLIVQHAFEYLLNTFVNIQWFSREHNLNIRF